MKRLILFALIIIAPKYFCQNSEWTIYYAGSTINRLLSDGKALWLGTTDGLFKLDKDTGKKTFYNKNNSKFPEYAVTSIVKDTINSKGSLWVGLKSKHDSYKCLANFDGNKWTVYDETNSGIPNVQINTLAIDSKGNIWIGTNGQGLIKFKGTILKEYKTSNSELPSNYIYVLKFDLDGNLLVGTNHKLAKLILDQRETWEICDLTIYGIDDYDVIALDFDSNGNLWMATSDKVFAFDDLGLKIYDENNGLPSNGTIKCLTIDNENNVFVGKNFSVLKFDGSNWVVYDNQNSPFYRDQVYSMASDNNNVWAGFKNSGLFKFDGEDWFLVTSDKYLPTDFTLNVAQDSSGNIWVTTMLGIVKFDGSRWKLLDQSETGVSFQKSYPYAIHTDSQGNVWFGGDCCLLKYTGEEWINFDLSNLLNSSMYYITSITSDSNNVLWIASGLGLIKIDGSEWTVYNENNSGLPITEIVDLTIDKYNKLWIATREGLVKFDGINWIVYSTLNSGIPEDDLHALTSDNHGNIWIGDKDGRIIKFNGTDWTIYNTPVPYGPNVMLFDDETGTLWMGELYGGIITLTESDSGANWTIYDHSNSPLNGERIYDLDMDKYGNIWIASTDGGLAVYNKENIVSIKNEKKSVLKSFSLSQNYPNPFNPSTTIKYTIPPLETLHATSQQVQLKIYDILGREVATLVNEKQSPGNHEVTFDAIGLPSGIYFYKLRIGDFMETKKMVLLK